MTAADPVVSGPGGPEWRLAGHGYEAWIVATGATLRRLTFRERDLIVPFGADQPRPLYRGALVAPWPNRLADGRYRFDGREQQAPINEADRHHALHGLVHWAAWTPVDVSETSVTLEHFLPAQDGYPFPLRLVARFALTADGLVSTLRSTNLSAGPAPFGCCPHPYLRADGGRVDDWVLTLPAGQRLEVDDRLLPTGLVDATTVDCDFGAGAVIGARQIDHAFTRLGRDRSGTVVASVVHPATGRGAAISWGAWAPWVQVHTADRPEPENDRVGLAVEPMSCPPNAFNDPTGPPILPAGQTHLASWTIAAVG